MAVLSVEGKDLLEADGAIFEAPVSSALLTVAHVEQMSCMVLYIYIHVDACVKVYTCTYMRLYMWLYFMYFDIS